MQKEQPKWKVKLSVAMVAAVLASVAVNVYAEADSGLAEVVVTAQKRSESASKTPIALSVISGDDLRSAGIHSAKDLGDAMPNVQISESGIGMTKIAIRGVVSENTTEVGDPAAAFHIDGVYYGKPQTLQAAFMDIQRVEVLRGPQGTLYGRNATTGAINVITNKPESFFEAKLSVELGDYNTVATEGMVNLPVNDVLALRAAVSTSKHDGYLLTKNAVQQRNTDDRDNQSARLHALFKISPSVNWLLTLDHSEDGGAGGGTVELSATGQPASETGDAGRTYRRNVANSRRKQVVDGVTSELNWDLGPVTLTYLLASRSMNAQFVNNALPSDVSNVSNILDSDAKYDQVSHEIRLTSNSTGPLRWIAGYYNYDESGHIDFILPDMVLVPGMLEGLRFLQTSVKSRSEAVFGQLDYKPSDDLKLSLGLRQTSDRKGRIGATIIGSTINNFGVPAAPNFADVAFKKATWKLGADYVIDPRTMVYASIGTGYKAGGYFDGTQNNLYAPENLKALEVGVKGRFFDNKVQLNASAFSEKFSDYQVSYLTDLCPLGAVSAAACVGGSVLGTVTTNAGQATINGLELEGKWLMTGADRISFGAGVLDTKFDKFMDPTKTTLNHAGEELYRAPAFSLNLGYDHTWSLASGADVAFHIATKYSDKYRLLFSNSVSGQLDAYIQKAFTKTDLSLTYTAAGDAWYVQGFVRNLENRNVVTDVSERNGALAAPRTVGVRFGISFR